MRILFITSSRVGDAVLTTGLLKHLIDKYPTAKFTIACGPAAQRLFDNVPRLDRVISMRKGPLLAHWRKLLGITIRRQWYMVVDMRGSAIAWCLLNQNVSTVILGASKLTQLEENLKSSEVVGLLDEDIQRELLSI